MHKRILLHPASILVVLCAGVLIGGATYKAIAGTYTVKGVVPAAPLLNGAIITSPKHGATLNTASLTAIGTCPADSYVKLYDNDTFSGTSWCSNGAFQVASTSFSGANVLRAQAYNVTDNPGPASPTVTVTYTPPAAAPEPTDRDNTEPQNDTHTTTHATQSQPASSVPLLLTADFHYQTFLTGSLFKWSLDLEGGTPPYAVHINWGDSQTSNLTFKVDPVFWIQHTYNHGGYYPISIKSVDAAGGVRVIQLAALIKLSGATGVFSSTTAPPTHAAAQAGMSWFFHHLPGWLMVAAPSYMVVLLMLISFRLGEREGYLGFLRRYRTAKRFAHRYRS